MNYLKLTAAIILFASTSSNAQSQFYLKPFVGAGIGKITEKTNNPAFANLPDNKIVLSLTGGINAGVQINQLRLETGLQLLTTGNQHEVTMSVSPTTPFGDSFKVTETHKHILLPLSAGHTFNITDKFTITPMAGIGAGFVAAVTNHFYSYSTKNSSKDTYSGSQAGYNALILWGSVSTSFDYKFNDRLSLSLAPTFNRMITNSIKEPSTAVYDFTERHYAITGNLGLIIRL